MRALRKLRNKAVTILRQHCLGSPRVHPHQQARKSPRVRCQTCDRQMERTIGAHQKRAGVAVTSRPEEGTEALSLQADPVGRFPHTSHLLPAPPVSQPASCKLQTTLQKGSEDQLLQTIFLREHRASVEWHSRGHSGSGSGLSFQKATQTTFLLTLFLYFILLCHLCVYPFFFPPFCVRNP